MYIELLELNSSDLKSLSVDGLEAELEKWVKLVH